MRQFVPTLLRTAQIAPGQSALDVATGTGIAAQDALDAVGTSGRVTAVDNSLSMLEQAQARLAGYSNAKVESADAQHLALPDHSLDTVICCMSLMIFQDRLSALAGMRRVLRGGGHIAVSVNTRPDRTLTGSVRLLIAKACAERREAIETHYARRVCHRAGPGASVTQRSSDGGETVGTPSA
jgi:ubiquinone/menaquinone biosynthesis C-methylase UbiE